MGRRYTYKQLNREFNFVQENRRKLQSDVQKIELTLAATLMTILFPLGYVLELSGHNRIALIVALFFLCASLLSGLLSVRATLREWGIIQTTLSNCLNNYERWFSLLPVEDQQRQLEVHQSKTHKFLAKFSSICLVLGIGVLFFLLCLILFF